MVYAIGFLDNQGSGSRSDQRLRLTQMATESGGSAFFPSTMKEIEEAYDTIVSQVRSQYTLGYISTNTATDGRWRKVEIRARPPAASGARIQSRKGYFAPYRAN
jgi:Ca-activated chloride channel homolog